MRDGTEQRFVMNDQYILNALIFLNLLAILGFIFTARTPPQTNAELLWFIVAAFGVYGTAIAAIAIKRE